MVDTLILPASDVAFLRGIKKTALLLLCLVRLDGRPATARQVANILSADYETTCRQLHDLAALGMVTDTRIGWILTSGGSQLLLPAAMAVDNAVDNCAEKPRGDADSALNATVELGISAEKPRLNPPPSLAPLLPYSIKEEEEEEEAEERGKTALNALKSVGVSLSPTLEDLVNSRPYITAEYVRAHAERLKRERKWSTGLLITVLRCGDGMPETPPWQAGDGDPHRYVEGDYSEFIEH